LRDAGAAGELRRSRGVDIDIRQLLGHDKEVEVASGTVAGFCDGAEDKSEIDLFSDGGKRFVSVDGDDSICCCGMTSTGTA